MSIFFTSDLHFSHERIIEMCNRPFVSVDDMNETMIRNHNNMVSPNDVVYFMGDVAMGKLADSLPLVARMNGQKTLILGNHDRPSPCYHHKNEEKRREWVHTYDQYFQHIVETMEMPFGPNGEMVLMHHFPYADPGYVDHAYEGRYQEFQPKDNGMPLFCGHVHNSFKVKKTAKGTPVINVGVDVWGFAPVSIETLLSILRKE